MRLKGDITPQAQETLHRKLLPALERMGKTARMMIDPEQLMFVQQSDDGTDGALLKLELPTDFVFENFYISSAYRNKIAFVLTPSLLVKVFAAASTIEADTMHMNLTTIPLLNDDGTPVAAPDGRNASQPVLRFTARGLEHTSVQDVPISKPFHQKGVDELLAMLDVVGLMDWYVNIHDHLPKIEALLQIVAKNEHWVKLLATKAGELHLQVESEFKVQGLELRPLPLIPQQLEQDPPAAAATTAARFDACMARDVAECPRGEVQTKALSRALAAAALPGAELVLLSCGDEHHPIVHIMCSFVGQDGTVDGYSLNVWLPTRDPGGD
eukprot:jgi/Ulvmu1/11706/UM008_0117.1